MQSSSWVIKLKKFSQIRDLNQKDQSDDGGEPWYRTVDAYDAPDVALVVGSCLVPPPPLLLLSEAKRPSLSSRISCHTFLSLTQ
jgi:hypothetical protein